MEHPRSWINIIKLGKSEVIRLLQSRGIAIQGKFQYWQLCSSLYQVEQAERFELMMSECDLLFQEAETVLASAQKQIEDFKQN